MEENVTNQAAEQTAGGVTFMDLWHILTKYFWRILLLAVIFTLIEAGVSKVLIKTSYSATASIIMNPSLMYYEGETDTSVSGKAANSDLSLKYNTYTYAIRMLASITQFTKTSLRVQDDVLEKSKDQTANPGVESLKKGSISVSTKEDELQIFITYTTKTSPEAAKATVIALANSVCEMSNAQAEDGQELYLWANTLHVDDLPEKVTSTNRWLLFVAIAFVLFFILAYLYYVIVTLTDDSIKSKHEIEELTGFNVMAYIEDINPERVKKAKANSAASGDKN